MVDFSQHNIPSCLSLYLFVVIHLSVVLQHPLLSFTSILYVYLTHFNRKRGFYSVLIRLYIYKFVSTYSWRVYSEHVCKN